MDHSHKLPINDAIGEDPIHIFVRHVIIFGEHDFIVAHARTTISGFLKNIMCYLFELECRSRLCTQVKQGINIMVRQWQPPNRFSEILHAHQTSRLNFISLQALITRGIIKEL